MRYRLFGSTGLRVSELCLGTMTFGETWGTMGASREVCRAIFDRFAERGGNFIDTASNYQGGESEKMTGEFIRADRDRFVLATKYTLAQRTGDPNGWGNHRKNMVSSVEASLKRLGTDRIDLLWLHIWDFTVPVEEVIRGVDDLARAGKILHAGASDTPAWVVARANAHAAARDRIGFSAVQVEYNLLERTVEHEIVPMARAFDLPVCAWSPLAMGVLTGKYTGAGMGAGGAGGAGGGVGAIDAGRAEWVTERLGGNAHAITQVVIDLARAAGCTPAQVALAWLLQRPGNVVPILGARTRAQIDDVLGAAEIRLDDAALARLDGASAIEPIFPASMWADDRLVADIITGGTQHFIDGWRRF